MTILKIALLAIFIFGICILIDGTKYDNNHKEDK
jgi:hypothetical protein